MMFSPSHGGASRRQRGPVPGPFRRLQRVYTTRDVPLIGSAPARRYIRHNVKLERSLYLEEWCGYNS